MNINSIFNFFLNSNLKMLIILLPFCVMCSIYTLNKSSKKECNVYASYGALGSIYLFICFLLIDSTIEGVLGIIINGVKSQFTIYKLLLFGALSLILFLPHTLKQVKFLVKSYSMPAGIVHYISLLTYGFIMFLWFFIRIILLPLAFVIPALAFNSANKDD